MLKHWFVTLLTMTNLTTARCQGVDSAYIATIDSIIQAEEMRKQLLAMKKNYEQLQIDEEMKFNLGGLESLVSWGFSYWRDKKARDYSFGNLAPENRTTSLIHCVPAVAPLATAWILKASGLESRSSTQRMAMANALSYALTTGMTLSLSSSYNSVGPDGTEHSMPSQHTALAFASATILSREYGYLSPWVSVGAYSCAAATQVLRMRGSQHWSGDIILGAGIGTLSTNIAYMLTNAVFGREAINNLEMRRSDFLRVLRFQSHPSNVNMFYGKEIGSRTLSLQENADNVRFRLSESQMIGVGFEQFYNPYFAIGATASYSSAVILMESINECEAYNRNYNADHLDFMHADLILKLSMPIQQTLRIGLLADAGVRYNTSSTFSPVYNTENVTVPLSDYSLPSQLRFEVGGGMSFDFLKRNKSVFAIQFLYHRAFTDLLPNRFSVGSTLRVFY